MTRAIAAGLNMCFFPTDKMYFDAIAHTEAHIASERYCINVPSDGGVMIHMSMSAVIYTDSVLVGASNTLAKIALVSHEVPRMITHEIKKLRGVKGARPNEPKSE